MESKRCEKCGETVEASKAFCPGCGAAMLAEEERAGTTSFEATPGTVQYGKTMFGKVLSEMGLNISDAPNKTKTPGGGFNSQAAPAAAAIPKPPAAAEKSSKLKWIVIGILLLLLLGAIAVVAAAALVLLYLKYQQPSV